MDWKHENPYDYRGWEEPYKEEDNKEETPCDRCARHGYVYCSPNCPEMGPKVPEYYD